MYLVKCSGCNSKRIYENLLFSADRCPDCNSLKFGLRKGRLLSDKEFESLSIREIRPVRYETGFENYSDEDLKKLAPNFKGAETELMFRHTVLERIAL